MRPIARPAFLDCPTCKVLVAHLEYVSPEISWTAKGIVGEANRASIQGWHDRGHPGVEQRVERAGTFLKVVHDPGANYFVIEEREGGMFSMTFDEWDLLVPAVQKVRSPDEPKSFRQSVRALAVPCPTCKAPIGEVCRYESSGLTMQKHHSARYRAAKED